MKLVTRLVLLVVAVVWTSLTSLAEANSPFQTETFVFPTTNPYFDCIGESLSGRDWITARYRGFETSSGTFHYLEHWKATSELVGDVTGRVWLSRWESPGTGNAGPGDVGFLTANAIFQPAIGHGPKFRIKVRFKYTFNANGELKVLVNTQYGEGFKCIGPKG